MKGCREGRFNRCPPRCAARIRKIEGDMPSHGSHGTVHRHIKSRRCRADSGHGPTWWSRYWACKEARTRQSRAMSDPARQSRPGPSCSPEFQTHCLNVTCVQCKNGKSISPIDSAQPTMAHDADTDSDLARPPNGKHDKEASISAERYSGYATAECAPAHRQPCCGAPGSQ